MLFQTVIAPNFIMNGTSRLVGADNAFFQEIAVRLAEKIGRDGWGSWSVNPAIGAAVNVAV